MNEWNELVEIANNKGVDVIEKNLDIYGLAGLWDADLKEININQNIKPELKPQTLAHELIHAIDPVCKLEPENEAAEQAAELRAELGAKLIIGQSYIDDGYIDDVAAGDIDLLLNCINEAEALVKSLNL